MRASWILLVLASPLHGAAEPLITGLSTGSCPPNTRIIIDGKGFGTDGIATIGGSQAIATRWSDTRIHCYVPYNLRVGAAQVRVESASGVSEPAKLQVEEKSGVDGQLRWRFMTDGSPEIQFVHVDVTGRVYVSDYLGLYALSAEGDLLWFTPGSGGDLPIDSDAQGIVYTGIYPGFGTTELIRAHDRNGNIIWRFHSPFVNLLFAGPNVGPDGNIYAAQDAWDGGLGAFSLTTAGNFRWSNVGDEILGPTVSPGTNNAIVFSDERLYLGRVNVGSGPSSATYAFDFAGNQIWFTGNSGLGIQFPRFPVVDALGRAAGPRGQTGVYVVDEDGNIDISVFHPNGASLMYMVAADDFGNIYAHDFSGADLWSIDQFGTTRWLRPTDPNHYSYWIDISPSNATLANAGTIHDTGEMYFRAMDPASGVELWRYLEPPENGIRLRPTGWKPAFRRPVATRSRSESLSTVYFTAGFYGGGSQTPEHGYLYAFGVR